MEAGRTGLNPRMYRSSLERYILEISGSFQSRSSDFGSFQRALRESAPREAEGFRTERIDPIGWTDSGVDERQSTPWGGQLMLQRPFSFTDTKVLGVGFRRSHIFHFIYC